MEAFLRGFAIRTIPWREYYLDENVECYWKWNIVSYYWRGVCSQCIGAGPFRQDGRTGADPRRGYIQD